MSRGKIAAAAVGVAALALSACGSGDDGGTSGGDGTTLSVAANLGGYGEQMYADVVAAFEDANPGTTVELTVSRTLAQELTPQVAAGSYPDVVILGQGAEEGFTESFVRDRALTDLTDVLGMTPAGEDQTVGEKLTDGIVGNLNTNPYGDDQVYLMPMYASPTGLVYDAGLMAEQGWEVPTTWDEFFALGDAAAAEGISLFTYPTAGYLDSYFFALLATIGGPDFYRDVMTYQTDVWDSPEATEALDLTTRLLTEYTAPTTVGFANGQDFTRNQQSILDGTTLFMPNGTWIVNEMVDAPRADSFEWALMPVPATEPGGDRYLTTFVESAWVPAQADDPDLAKEFIAFLYSDEAAAIFAETAAIQPIAGLADTLEGPSADFYAVFAEPGVNALVGAFAATEPVPGVDLNATLLEAANAVVSGTQTQEQWQQSVSEASNRLGASSD